MGGKLSSRRSVFFASLFLTGALFLVARPAHAQYGGDEQARQLYMQGDRYYSEGRYEEAVQAFEQAYQLSGRPLLLYNLANAYERLGRYADALDALRRYEPNAQPNEQAEIRVRIQNLEQRAAESGATYDEGLVAIGAIIGSVGLGLGVGGIVLGVLALDAREEAEGLCLDTASGTLCDARARDAIERDTLFSLFSDIGIVVGSAALVAGLIMLIVGATSYGEESYVTATARVVPYFIPRLDGGELGAAVSF